MNFRTYFSGSILTALFLVTLFSAHVFAPSHPEFATTIRVSLFEWGISLEQPEAVEGTVIFEIVNEGTMDHALKIGGLASGIAETEVFPPGSSRTLNVELAPGQYDIWCPIPGHRSQGMETTLRITEAQPEPPGPGSSASPSDFDEDGNCFLSDAEFFVAIDFWIEESISNQLFFDVVDAWIGEENVCAAQAAHKSFSVSASMTAGNGVHFTSSFSAPSSLSVEIFDLQGSSVTSLERQRKRAQMEPQRLSGRSNAQWRLSLPQPGERWQWRSCHAEHSEARAT